MMRYTVTQMLVLINPHIEHLLKTTILPDLDQGRKNFDKPHTEAVVYWTKQLLQQKPCAHLDAQVLITAAYAHDWGYFQLFEGVNSDDPAEIAQRKPQHMERGAHMIADLIEKDLERYFTLAQKQLVIHLVAVHDQVEKLTTEEELLIMEADTLGMLDADRVKPTFSKAENEIFIQDQFYDRRLPLFKHAFAKQKAAELVKKRVGFYD